MSRGSSGFARHSLSSNSPPQRNVWRIARIHDASVTNAHIKRSSEFDDPFPGPRKNGGLTFFRLAAIGSGLFVPAQSVRCPMPALRGHRHDFIFAGYIAESAKRDGKRTFDDL
jgi:hypothetical protein